MVWPALIAAGASLVGGALSKKSAKDTSQQEYERQKEFAQMGLRWKVEDAKAAGLHPLAAIGAGGASYSPTISAGGGPDYSGLASAAGDLTRQLMERDGQNLNRAKAATMTDTEKEMQQLALERARLQNRLLDAQITTEWANVMGQPRTPSMPAAVGPSVPSVGAVKVEPSKTISRLPGESGTEAATAPAFQYIDIGRGQKIRALNEKSAEIAESYGKWFAPLLTGYAAARDMVMGPEQAPKMSLPKGSSWVWNPWTQSWSVEGPRVPTPLNRPGRGMNFDPRSRR